MPRGARLHGCGGEREGGVLANHHDLFRTPSALYPATLYRSEATVIMGCSSQAWRPGYSGVFWGTLHTGYTASPTGNTPIKWSQKVAVAWCGHHRGVHIITGNLCPIPAHAHIGAIMPETLESTPPSQTTGAGAQIRTLGNRRRRTMLDAGRSTPSQSDANARSSLLRTRTRPTRNGDASANVLPSRLPLIRLG